MTDLELKKLRRTDLLELLLAQEKEIEMLQSQLQEAKALLKDRRIMLAEAGSIAEASLQINGVFQAAQAAAEQYLDSVRQISEEKERYFACLEETAVSKADQRLRETEALCNRMEAESKEKAALILRDAELKRKILLEETKKDLKRYWVGVSARMEEQYKKQLEEKKQA